MNNPNITLSQVRAALQLKTDSLLSTMKLEHEKCRMSLYFIKNLDLESQLVLLQLQHPEEHKNLIEYTENYLNERLTIS